MKSAATPSVQQARRPNPREERWPRDDLKPTADPRAEQQDRNGQAPDQHKARAASPVTAAGGFARFADARRSPLVSFGVGSAEGLAIIQRR